jgi:hypothetical protein
MGIAQNLTQYGFSPGSFKIQPRLYHTFEDNAWYRDVRRDWAIADYRFIANSDPPAKEYWSAVDPNKTQLYNRFIGKYRRDYELNPDKVKNNCGTNFPLLRYSDVLLMAAEAENALNGPTEKAHGWLNEVRSRAETSPVEGVTQKDEFLRIIRDERYMELCFEGLRKLDLIRWGILLERLNEVLDYNRQNGYTSNVPLENVSEKDYYLPIPSRELTLNRKLVQNPGW